MARGSTHPVRWLLIAAFCTAPFAVLAQTQLQVLSGSGDLQQWSPSVNVESGVPLSFRWWTGDAGVTGARWDAELFGSSTPIATGVVTGSPDAAHPAGFTLPAATFLTAAAAANPVAYTVHITALAGTLAGAASAPVVVNEGQAGTANFGNLTDTPPSTPIETGHPAATLIAYKPIPATPVHGVQQGMATLEFSDPGPAATSPVFVTVTDLKQVVRQTDIQVLVPSLTAGANFRVAVALGPFTITGDTATQGWPQRHAKGVSLLVGTAKLGSPYVQYQQPPVLTGASAKCVGEGCGTTSPPWVAQIRPTDLAYRYDESVAAGQDFLYTGDYIYFDVFQKKARTPIDLSATDLSSTSAASALAWKGGGEATLFRDFWYPGSSRDVNPSALPQNRPIPCDPAHPSDLDGNGNFIKDAYGFPTTACINQFYDARLTYDDLRRRFWIVTHAASDINPSVPCGKLPPAQCLARGNELAHRVFVAVSKAESPSAGFTTTIVDDLNVDWEMMGVHGRYALFFYRNPQRLRLYDADSLVQGVAKELTPSYTAAEFGNGTVRLPKHHDIRSNVAFITSASGPVMRVYAWTATTGRPTSLNPAVFEDPAGDRFDTAQDNYQAAFRGQYLYVTTTDKVRVLVWRMPVSISADGKSVVINPTAVRKWIIKDAGVAPFKLDNPSIDVTINNDVVVSYRAWNGVAPDQVWFDVLYSGENAFRQAKVLSAPPTGDSSGARFDFGSSSVDPTDEETVWIMSKDGRGAVVGSVRP